MLRLWPFVDVILQHCQLHYLFIQHDFGCMQVSSLHVRLRVPHHYPYEDTINIAFLFH